MAVMKKLLFLVPLLCSAAGAYTVRPGDSLWAIAQKTGTTTSALMTANSLQSSVIHVGQVLNVPSPAQPSRVNSYIVRVGDTLSTIAQRYSLGVGDLKRNNALAGDIIYPGQRLNIYSSARRTRLFTPASLPNAQSRWTWKGEGKAPTAAYLSAVGHEHQTLNNCGPAAVAAALQYYGERVDQTTYQYAMRGDDPVALTSYQDIAKTLGDLGYEAPIVTGRGLEEVLREVALGHPVLVLQYHSDVGKTPHWRVVRGYDRTKQLVVMSDSLSGANVALSFADFELLWQRFNDLMIPVRPG